ncbi:hypothetical protein HDU98_010189 [Podochytrium sp. JEL0797]|nr:hypothetical protein HDU98_010189 [Podochytrium sp. JEL0797]
MGHSRASNTTSGSSSLSIPQFLNTTTTPFHPSSALDAEIFDNPSILHLHQTWKTTCVHASKAPEMLSWHHHGQSNNNSMWEQDPNDRTRTVFYDNAAMDAWVRQRFMGTKAYTVWSWIALPDEFTNPSVLDEELQYAGVKRSDLFRIMLMWYYGGLYMDVDVRRGKSWRPLLEGNTAVMAWEAFVDQEYALCGMYASSAPGHPFFAFLLTEVVDTIHAMGRRRARRIGPMVFAGPTIVGQTVRRYERKCGGEREGESKLVQLPNAVVEGAAGDRDTCVGCWANHIHTCTWCKEGGGETEGTPEGCLEVAEFMPAGSFILVTKD